MYVTYIKSLRSAVKDSTFPETGKIGLWTKADAWTYFENLMLNDT